MLPITPISISILREHQRQQRNILSIDPARTEDEVLEKAQAQATLREERYIRVGEFIRDGSGNKFPIKLDELRLKRTRDIIRRSVPGVDEDPTYLELMARQAASIEIALRKEHTGSPDPKMSALCDRIDIGTVPEFNPSALSGPAGHHFLVVLSTGLMSFLFQAAKATVLSWRPQKPREGTTYGISPAAKDVEYVLSRNPYPLELLYRTLHLYLFEGMPRLELSLGGSLHLAGHPDLPTPPEYAPFLGWLTDYCERFVIAHEYGHAVLEEMDFAAAYAYEHLEWRKEVQADTFAFLFTILSALHLDLIPPNYALQGGLFVFSAFEVVRNAIDIVRYGAIREQDRGLGDHPPTRQRIELLKELYLREFGNQEDDQRYSLDIEGALHPSETLDLLWGRIKDRFKVAREKGHKLHPIWESEQTLGTAV